MTDWLRRNRGFIVTALVIAGAVHVASVAAIPHVVMRVALDRMTRTAGLNTMTHTARATAASHGVVRPSPDLLYSACPFDLDRAGGALRVHATAMPDTYWSVSGFDAQTNNIYVLNDRQAKSGSVDVVIVGPHTGLIDDARTNAPPQVRSPTTRGLVLFRTLIDNDAHLAAIDAARRHASCEPYRG
jgi:uncharacterized membrane protein